MASSHDAAASLDIAYLVAALVEEAGGELTVSTEWFSLEDSPFLGKQIRIDEAEGLLHITLVEGE